MSGVDERRYQVFVSSTFEDLQEERQKALQAVLELKAFPAGMELFPSADDEQWAFIQREIESSDYYVLITAGKYGSLAAEGISFTEKEYDYAVGLKKYVMSFVRHDLSKVAAGQSEMDPERRQKLEAFHRKVKQNKLVRFYTNPHELKAQVMQALMHAFQFQPKEGWVRAKHARRIEDLEEVARLQKDISQLAQERAQLAQKNQQLSSHVAALSKSPLLLAQGDDEVDWKVRYECNSSEHAPDAPEASFVFKSTWNQLFVSIFWDLPNKASREEIRTRICDSVAGEFVHGYPEYGDCIETGSRPSFAPDDLDSIVNGCRIQFQGLGLISVRYDDTWWLEQKGIKQLCSVKGMHRPHASTT
jgi:hypothetical protein